MKSPLRSADTRRGAAAVEFALVLPILALLLVAGIDFGRVLYHAQTIENCARNGALYKSDPASPLLRKYADYRECAIADGSNLVPALTVDNVTVTSDAKESTVSVTVSYEVEMLCSYLKFNNDKVKLEKTVTMRVLPLTPN
jgi:Flp pilus assembly protein TadG